MDINMPGINGLEATQLITSEQPNCRVLVFSTPSAAEYEPLALEAGVNGFIAKAELDPSSLVESWRAAEDDSGHGHLASVPLDGGCHPMKRFGNRDES